MTNNQKIQILKDVAEACDGDYRSDYSGRGMFGRTCCGIVVSDEIDAIGRLGAKGLRNPQRDNMGRDTILYFPFLKEAETPEESAV